MNDILRDFRSSSIIPDFLAFKFLGIFLSFETRTLIPKFSAEISLTNNLVKGQKRKKK